VSKSYRPYEPRQSFLLPPSPLEWLPKKHLALFILDVVRELPLTKITHYYEREGRGFPPHHPQMMVTLLLYAYCIGVPSSRKIERRTHEDVAFRVVAGNTHPDHTCISEFRRIHLQALSELFVKVLHICQRMGLVKLGHVALDGTKVKANASKHKAMSYERMKEEENRLAQKVAVLMKAAEDTDAAEDAEHGKRRPGDEIPEELARAERRLERIREAKAALEAEAQEQAHQREAQAREAAQTEAAIAEMANVRAARGTAKDDDSDEPPPPPSTTTPEPLPSHQVPVGKDGAPTPKAQRNFTDAESRIMKTGDGYVQGYNGQIVVDETHQIIVAQGLSNQPPDAEHLVPMLDRVIENCGAVPTVMSADNGYLSEANVARAEARGVDIHLAPGRAKHGSAEFWAPSSDGTAKARMAAKLSTPDGKRLYSRRKVIVEPVFGQIKNRGFRHFLLRGLQKVRGEWALITMSHNLLKLFAASLRIAVPA
jgi:transposase